ncbi:MAG: D-alanyl-D-alanine carboxypeptidase [Thermodesulfobacteriota bacterium]
MVNTLFKKYVVIGIWALFLLLFNQSESNPQTPPDGFITARAAFLMNADTGAILYEKNPDLPLPPASTTKIMTAIVALDKKPPDAFLRVSKDATLVSPCKIGVRPGESWQVEDLIFSILLNSANDASLVVAEGTAGSVEEFTRLMNRKAKEAGASNTHFVNPHGLDQRDHYATVRDMALIFKYAMSNPILREVLKTKSISIRGPGSRLVHLRNHNRLLGNFEGMIGGKTGYTSQARRCFVGEASRDGKNLLVCVFGSKDHFRDTARLLDYGFNGDVAEERSNSFRVQKHENEVPYNFKSRKRGYVLQVATFSRKRMAADLRQTLLKKGFPSFIENASLENGVARHRVKVGLYPNLKIAKKTKERIKKRFGIHSVIIRQYS